VHQEHRVCQKPGAYGTMPTPVTRTETMTTTPVPRPVTHVIFDMDGLLLDTEGFYTEATQRIVARYGKVFDWSIKANMVGRSSLAAARYLVETLELPLTAEAYLQDRRSLLEARFPEAEPMPGARRLTDHLHNHGVPMAVASSSDQGFFALKTQRHRDWFACFEAVVLGDDPALAHGKPAPDIFLLAAARLGAEPDRCLVFEDAPSGVAAARAAGMQVVAVPDPAMDRARYGEADLVLDSLDELEPECFGLPAF